MAWLADEVHEFYEDCKDKKITARSARSSRTHCGKRGQVKFPSDYMTPKEREAMNGKCVSYRMNDPITWDEFKTWPDEHKVTYIKLLRKKYQVPDSALAGAWGLCKSALTKPFAKLGLNKGEGAGPRNWDKEGFYAWWNGVPKSQVGIVELSETPVEEEVEEETTEGRDELIVVNDDAEITIKHMEDELSEIAEQFGIDLNDEDDTPAWYDDECDNDHTCSYAPDCMKKRIRDAGPIAFAGNSIPVIPSRGTITFDNNEAEDALTTIKTLLGSMRVNMSITWFKVE